MSNIEPTEEQKQAAGDLYSTKELWLLDGWWVVDHIARLLAEREAKLRDEVAELSKGWRADEDEIERLRERYDEHDHALRVEASDLEHALEAARAELKTERLVAEKALAARNEMENERDAARRDLKQSKAMSEAARDTLQARVAELEVHANTAMDNRDAHKAYAIELEEREAQHLADIKALREALDDVLNDPNDIGEEDARDAGEALLARLAHYDDAKADAPTVDMQAWANGSCPEPGCSLANPHEQGAACVKPTAEGGEG